VTYINISQYLILKLKSWLNFKTGKMLLKGFLYNFILKLITWLNLKTEKMLLKDFCNRLGFFQYKILKYLLGQSCLVYYSNILWCFIFCICYTIPMLYFALVSSVVDQPSDGFTFWPTTQPRTTERSLWVAFTFESELAGGGFCLFYLAESIGIQSLCEWLVDASVNHRWPLTSHPKPPLSPFSGDFCDAVPLL